MKIEYKILWLDDQIQDFIDDEIIADVEKHLREQGFQPKIDAVSNSEHFFKLLDQSYDLILTDYHLNDINGDEVIKKIRSQEFSVMSEVLFYTAKADLKDTNKINRVSFLETNTLLGDHRGLVLQATKNLISLTIKKFQNIVAMRGMIMHETSILDQLCLELISDYFEKTNSITVKESTFKEVTSFYERKLDEITKYKKNDRFEKVLKDPLLFSFSQRANALKSIVNEVGFKDFIDDFKCEVIKIRNQFAHAVLERDENGKEFFRHKEEGIEFNEDFCKEIRKNIIKHKNNLDGLKSELNK